LVTKKNEVGPIEDMQNLQKEISDNFNNFDSLDSINGVNGIDTLSDLNLKSNFSTPKGNSIHQPSFQDGFYFSLLKNSSNPSSFANMLCSISV